MLSKKIISLFSTVNASAIKSLGVIGAG